MKKRSFISANEARQMTDTANFAASPFVMSVDEAIRNRAASGGDTIEIIVPRERCDKIVKLMEYRGFQVTLGDACFIGQPVIIAW